jgi:hypothetical protein
LNRTRSNEGDCTAGDGRVMQSLVKEAKVHTWRNVKQSRFCVFRAGLVRAVLNVGIRICGFEARSLIGHV